MQVLTPPGYIAARAKEIKAAESYGCHHVGLCPAEPLAIKRRRQCRGQL
jgi:hypothetical protein